MGTEPSHSCSKRKSAGYLEDERKVLVLWCATDYLPAFFKCVIVEASHLPHLTVKIAESWSKNLWPDFFFPSAANIKPWVYPPLRTDHLLTMFNVMLTVLCRARSPDSKSRILTTCSATGHWCWCFSSAEKAHISPSTWWYLCYFIEKFLTMFVVYRPTTFFTVRIPWRLTLVYEANISIDHQINQNGRRKSTATGNLYKS